MYERYEPSKPTWNSSMSVRKTKKIEFSQRLSDSFYNQVIDEADAKEDCK